jgi:hypothetical protein
MVALRSGVVVYKQRKPTANGLGHAMGYVLLRGIRDQLKCLGIFSNQTKIQSASR